MSSPQIFNTIYGRRKKYDIIYVYSPEYPNTWIDPKLGSGLVTDSLQEALDKIAGGGSIYVGRGVYTPTKVCEDLAAETGAVRDRCRTYVFHDLPNNVIISGGFKGDETTTEIGVIGGRVASYNFKTRYTFSYPTILSGDLNGVESDRAYHVIYNKGYVNRNYEYDILDGCTITKGRADGDGINGYGGGIYECGIYYSELAFRNCRITECYASTNGAAVKDILVRYKSYSRTHDNCLTNNSGGSSNVYSYYGENIKMVDISIIETSINLLRVASVVSTGYSFYRSYLNGGHVSVFGVVGFNNCLFLDCIIDKAFHLRAGDTNSLYRGFQNNTVIGGLFNISLNNSTRDSYFILLNNIFDCEVNVVLNTYIIPNTYEFINCYIKSLVGTGIANVINTNPISQPSYLDESNDNYQLQPYSAGIDEGDAVLLYSSTDILGNPRIVDTVDIGCFEHQGTIYQPTITVQDGSGTPIAGATVELLGVQLTTDAQGQVSQKLDAGIYQLSVSAAGYNTANEELDSTSDLTITLSSSVCQVGVQIGRAHV